MESWFSTMKSELGERFRTAAATKHTRRVREPWRRPPMLALALGLRRAGHEVLLTVPPEHVARVEPSGCPVRALGAGFKGNPVITEPTTQALRRFIKQELSSEIRDLPAIARGSDLVLATGLAFGAASVAEHFGASYRMVTFAPEAMLGTSKDPLWIRLAGWLARVVSNASFRGLLNRERVTLGLPPAPTFLPAGPASGRSPRPTRRTDPLAEAGGRARHRSASGGHEASLSPRWPGRSPIASRIPAQGRARSRRGSRARTASRARSPHRERMRRPAAADAALVGV